jgi:hypothetical protein
LISPLAATVVRGSRPRLRVWASARAWLRAFDTPGKATAAPGAKPDAAKAFGRTFAERKGIPIGDEANSSQGEIYMLRDVASTPDANLQATRREADTAD